MGQEIDPEQAGPLERSHDQDTGKGGLHLLGLTRLYDGLDIAGAREAWSKGHELDPGGPCALHELLEFLDQAWGAALGPRPSWLAQLVRDLAEADARLAAGDPAAALTLLDTPGVHRYPDLQSLARLGAAYLALPVTPPAVGWLRKRLALSSLLAQQAELARLGQSLHPSPPLGSATWSPERIRELCRQAEAWLEEDALARIESRDRA